MDAAVEAAIAAIARDNRSGSSALLGRGVELLQPLAVDRDSLVEAAERLCRAQPSMAGFRTLARLVRSEPDAAAALSMFALQIARAPAAIARNAVALLRLRARGGPLRVATCSASQAVEAAIVALASEVETIACCAEGRPQMEGRDLAARLADARVSVELYTDSGLGVAVPEVEAFLVGADAVGPDAFINKVGTAALCALARIAGVPVFVLAGREKRLSANDLSGLELSSGAPGDVWREPPPGVVVQNPFFERISLTHVSALVMDAGVINIS